MSIGFSHSVSQIPLSFPFDSPHSISEIPLIPLIPLGFLAYHCLFSLAYHWSFSFGSLSSPALSRFSLTIPLFSEEAGHHHRFKGQDTITIPLFSLSLSLSLAYHWSAPHPQFSSPSHPTVSPSVCVTLFVLDPVTRKQGRGWLGLVWGFLFLSRSCRMCKKKCVFLWLDCDEIG